MKQTIIMEKYPVNELGIAKNETTFKTVDEILNALKEKIEAHPIAAYIAIFDHYSHTESLGKNGEISDEILDAKNIIFCFGKQLPKPIMLAVRPRSIGVVELAESFVLSFMDAPNPQAHEAMIVWVQSIVNK